MPWIDGDVKSCTGNGYRLDDIYIYIIYIYIYIYFFF